MLATESPFQQYFELNGSPLDAGKLYFGLPNQDPETNPIPVFWDAAGTQPAAQPIRTMNGYTVRSGTPALVFVDGDYSINVRNKKGELLYYVPSSTDFSNMAKILADLADTTDPTKGDAMVGVKQPFPGAVGRTQHDKNAEFVSVKDFGAIGDGVAIEQASIKNAIDGVPDFGVLFFPPGVYKTTDAIIVGATRRRITFSGYGAILQCAHDGNGLDLTAQNENYGGHIVEGLSIYGPNVAYPNSEEELNGTSVGAAIQIDDGSTTNDAAGYNVILRDVELRQFLAGLRLRSAMLGKYHNIIARFNQYGVLIDGGQANANDFFAPTIRENRVAGIYSDGITAGALTYATQNRVWGGIVESNIPYRGDNPAGYAGGYRTSRDTTLVAGGHGIVLLNSYDFAINGTYFENQNFDVWISNSSDGHNFVTTRHGNGGNGRVGGFMLSGPGIANTTLVGCKAITNNTTDLNFVTDNANQFGNQLLDCEGFNFVPASLVSFPYIRNNRRDKGGLGGTPFGALAMPPQGFLNSPTEGTTAGTITGIGTATATLNVFGIGEIQFGGSITADTTITAISGGVPGQFLTIRNYQTAWTVKIASSADDFGLLLLKNKRTVRLNKLGQQMTLYCNSQSKWIEVGRNFSDRVKGYVQIAGAATTAAVTFSAAVPDAYDNEPDNGYFPMVSLWDITGAPVAGAWSVRAHSQSAAGFTISVNAAPGGATNVFVTWEAVR